VGHTMSAGDGGPPTCSNAACQGLTLVHFSAQRERFPLGPELDRQTGTFVDTESEIRAKRLPDCFPIGGSQLIRYFSSESLISKLEVQGLGKSLRLKRPVGLIARVTSRMGRQLEIIYFRCSPTMSRFAGPVQDLTVGQGLYVGGSSGGV